MKKQTKDILGTAVIGERGQVVIPKEARDLFKLKTGDTLLVMASHNAIIFLPKKNIQQFISQLTAKLAI